MNSQECSTGAPAEVCTTLNEQKCEIRYETVYEQVCDSAPSAPACTTVTEQQCTTVSEPVCTTVTEEQCSTTYVSQGAEECETVLEQKCETEYMVKYEEKCTTVRQDGISTVFFIFFGVFCFLSLLLSEKSYRAGSFSFKEKLLLIISGGLSTCLRGKVLLCAEKMEKEVWRLLDEQNRGQYGNFNN